jgi:uncharacterized membrane protein/predicted DsbA family dithiol-disulfide isomerase
MSESVTLDGVRWPRVVGFLAAVGMIVASLLTMQHFFAANYPASIYAGSFCDLNAFFNCDSSARSVLAEIGGVPLGTFGVMVGALFALGAVFPSPAFERTNKTISLLNGLGVVGLASFSTLYLGSLCLLCSGYWICSLVSLWLFWSHGIDRGQAGFFATWVRPSVAHLATFGVILAMGAYGARLFHEAKKDAQAGGVAARIVKQYFGLPEVASPSIISPFWPVRSTERFEDAPIQVIEYADFGCPDCLFLSKQIDRLKEEFAGQLNVAFQFFPLDAQCNQVVDKDKHPGACDLSYMAAHDPDKFVAMHHEIFANFEAAKDPAWRDDLARRYGVEAALGDPDTKALIASIIDTGTEYAKTSEEYAHGIRSTPTMILNNRLVIGTFPYEHLRAIFQALVDRQEGGKRFMEAWEES